MHSITNQEKKLDMHIGQKNYKKSRWKKKRKKRNGTKQRTEREREREGGGGVGFLLPTEIHNKRLDSSV